MSKPTAAQVCKLLRYDARTGNFYWKITVSNRRPAGSLAGSFDGNYWYISINYRRYGGHQLAVLIKTGQWPLKDVDHKDLDGSNNRWNNLRVATRSQNKGNECLRASNSSGFKGVSWNREKQKWQAQIKINYKNNHLGWYDSPKAAHIAYSNAAANHFGEFARV